MLRRKVKQSLGLESARGGCYSRSRMEAEGGVNFTRSGRGASWGKAACAQALRVKSGRQVKEEVNN